MKRQEAEGLVGSRVCAWTSANGVYIGTLREVKARKGRPWRGLVEIEGVVRPAAHFEAGRSVVRKGKDIGETIEVGGINIIIPPEEESYYVGRSYEAALAMEIVHLQSRRENSGRHGHLLEQSIKAMQLVLEKRQG